MYRADAKENTRLFILAGKGVKEETFREKFEQYGKIEDLWIVKDKRTNEDKGVVYVTYSKVSEAALALEEMNGKILPGNPRPLKVLVANTKRDGSVRDPREDERLVRLFVIIPKSFTEDDVTKEFSQHGDVASVNVLRDKDSGAPKGFAYVRFHRPYHAALALENCKPSFKPKWAEPKKPVGETVDKYARDFRDMRDQRDNYYDRSSRMFDDRDRDRGDRGDRRSSGAPGGYPYSDRDRGLKRGFDDYRDDRDIRRDRREDYIADDGRSRYSEGKPSDDMLYGRGVVEQTPFTMIQDHQHNNCQRLLVTAPLGLTQSYLHKLFNLIPGLEYCDLNEQTGLAYVRYQTPQCAAYAREKLDGFEYPIGSRLLVRFTEGSNQSNQDMRQGFDQMPEGYRGVGGPEPLMDSSSVQHQAAKVLEQAGINPDLVLQMNQHVQSQQMDNKLERVTYCNLKLPLPKPLVPEDAPVAERLFIVCQPAAVPERILRDAFSRFGNLIEVYLLSGRNFGYAKYATKDSAAMAIEKLHGQCVAGQRLKVLEAEPQKNPTDEDGHKRQRVESLN
ncbi:RNA-binding protein 45-like [Mercenaria mercenaria]|uniref:RNA-binding protein 45-like n=1 Tax=Mercenaria mercenaria TaxID=6596 RepID=UPI001E1D3562|nr:RNA-binding protein 45-like [Mercenaria mercenaria]XP_045168629.1 RNA-binding protein 45-like [Mercenaria mercenaria]